MSSNLQLVKCKETGWSKLYKNMINCATIRWLYILEWVFATYTHTRTSFLHLFSR